MRLMKGLVRSLHCDLGKRETCRGFVKSIQISNSFYLNSLQLERSNRYHIKSFNGQSKAN